MNFLVVGPGAMGCLFAARLKTVGYDVTLLDHNKKRARRINEQGVSVNGVSGKYKVHIPTMAGNVPFSPDFVSICVKSNDTREAGESVSSSIGPDTIVFTLQNGLGNIETLAKIFGNEKILGGVTSQGSTLLGEGSIRHAGEGETIIGPKGKEEGPAQKLAYIMNKAGFKTHLTDNVEDLIWGKLIINVGINALTAITRLKNGRIPITNGTRKIMEEAVREAVTVAEAKGINLPYKEPLSKAIKVCEATKENVASMLQDVLKERITEVEMINGAIVREGYKLGIPTPVNRTLTNLVKAIQETYQERLR